MKNKKRNYKKRTCLICNKEFIPNNSTRKYCSLECLGIYIRNYHKKYYINHKEYYKKYYLDNAAKISIKKKKRYLKYRKKILEGIKNYYRSHKECIYKYIKFKLKTDLIYKIKHYLRTRINRALKGNPKISTTIKLVGCSIKKLKKHLEKQFKSGMSWSNYGKWHIDHIRPCASFDLSKPSQQRKCFHYTNLQPLWAEENLSKNKKNYGKHTKHKNN